MIKFIRDAKNKEKKASREANKGSLQDRKENSTITTLKDNIDNDEKAERYKKLSTCC